MSRKIATRCATCATGHRPELIRGQWVHLYADDGSFIGPCFDPPDTPHDEKGGKP